MKVDIPDNLRVECLSSIIYDAKPAAEGQALVKAALENPYGGLSLRELGRQAKSAVIICSDHTRPVPSKDIIPPMLEELRRGNSEIAITLLVATGFHRVTTQQELIAKFGEDIVRQEKIVVHDSADAASLTDLGALPSGARCIINKVALECDLLLAEGFIEPHFFAGYSGGRKSVLPGIAGRQTVLGNHCGAFIHSPYARTGILDGNPLHIDMCAAAEMAGLKYIVNVVINGKKEILKTFAGDWQLAHTAGCAYVDELARVKPTHPADIAITSNGGYPLDQNIYQAVKCMTAAEAAAKEGAVLIIASYCADGTGSQDFYEYLRDCASPEELYAQLAAIPMDETLPDQWEAQVLSRVMIKYKIIFVCGEKARAYADEMKLTTATDLDEALQMALEIAAPNPDITIIPDGISVIVK